MRLGLHHYKLFLGASGKISRPPRSPFGGDKNDVLRTRPELANQKFVQGVKRILVVPKLKEYIRLERVSERHIVKNAQLP